MLSKNSIVTLLTLTGVWIILRENISAVTVISGLIVSAIVMYARRAIFPLPSVGSVSVARLIFYLAYLIVQVYIAGIAAIKPIFTGAAADVITVKTSLPHPLSRTILANSVTFVPGSVTIDLIDDELTVIWLSAREPQPAETRSAKDARMTETPGNIETPRLAGAKRKAEDFIINKLEKRLDGVVK